MQAAALYSLASWAEASEAGDAALALLPRGGVLWCSTVERLLHMLPVLGEFQKAEALAEELFQVVPEPSARAAYLRAIYVQLLGHALSGARDRGRACLGWIDRLDRRFYEQDVAARGYDRMWRALFLFMLGSDVWTALELNRQCIEDLEQSQVLYRLSLSEGVAPAFREVTGATARRNASVLGPFQLGQRFIGESRKRSMLMRQTLAHFAPARIASIDELRR